MSALRAPEGLDLAGAGKIRQARNAEDHSGIHRWPSPERVHAYASAEYGLVLRLPPMGNTLAKGPAAGLRVDPAVELIEMAREVAAEGNRGGSFEPARAAGRR